MSEMRVYCVSDEMSAELGGVRRFVVMEAKKKRKIRKESQ